MTYTEGQLDGLKMKSGNEEYIIRKCVNGAYQLCYERGGQEQSLSPRTDIQDMLGYLNNGQWRVVSLGNAKPMAKKVYTASELNGMVVKDSHHTYYIQKRNQRAGEIGMYLRPTDKRAYMSMYEHIVVDNLNRNQYQVVSSAATVGEMFPIF